MSAYRVTAFRYTPLGVDAYVIDAEREVATAAAALQLMHAERKRTGVWPDVIRLRDNAYWSLDTRRFEAAAEQARTASADSGMLGRPA